MTAQPDVAEALAELEAWLDTYARDLPRDDEPGRELRQHLVLMRAEAERLRSQLQS
jgi:hypothetical protein